MSSISTFDFHKFADKLKRKKTTGDMSLITEREEKQKHKLEMQNQLAGTLVNVFGLEQIQIKRMTIEVATPDEGVGGRNGQKGVLPEWRGDWVGHEWRKVGREVGQNLEIQKRPSHQEYIMKTFQFIS